MVTYTITPSKILFELLKTLHYLICVLNCKADHYEFAARAQIGRNDQLGVPNSVPKPTDTVRGSHAELTLSRPYSSNLCLTGSPTVRSSKVDTS